MGSAPQPEDDADRCRAAFPTLLADAVERAITVLPQPTHPSIEPFVVMVLGEQVLIPRRVSYPEPARRSDFRRLSSTEQTILYCLYSRHHDGHVRQRAAERILDSSEEWVVPFVIQLVGEYVVEIIETIWNALGNLSNLTPSHRASYQRFVRQNCTFIKLTSARVDSYWACYYRDSYPDWSKTPNRSDYPGYRMIKALQALA